ncbi:MAG: hypothetical protein HWQ35_30090 [Nostoc sp. NMS1]|uniref:hypothetical protein n=1 Tax=unclassified Nostoc TaxID=2593658 RepID=UPI0025CFF0F8|nr:MULTISPECIES: hypothetical protein [unclassified Nostoc]MBN3910635.1 hypothetical protein [Nostoc sp. NMS1]MBN3994195.1 hypothetical protein [Nostoc sp. NMS2]
MQDPVFIHEEKIYQNYWLGQLNPSNCDRVACCNRISRSAQLKLTSEGCHLSFVTCTERLVPSEVEVSRSIGH